MTTVDLKLGSVTDSCSNNTNYGMSNIVCCQQVSVRIIYYLYTATHYNNVLSFTEMTSVYELLCSVCVR